MEYDPIKKSLGKFFNRSPLLRKLFYRLLDLLLLRSWHIRKEIKKWARNAPANARILDAGSGFGQYDYFISRIKPQWHILAVDVKEDQIADCSDFFTKINKPNVKFEIQDLTQFNLPDQFNMVLCVDVMEHILEDVQVFKNFATSLKKGGFLLISTPSDQGGSGIDDHKEGQVQGFIDEHVRDGYNIKEIKEKIQSSGFSACEPYYSYGTPGKISWKLSMYYPMKMLSLSKIFYVILPFYYLLTYPISFILNMIDVRMKHQSGTGLIVKAWK